MSTMIDWENTGDGFLYNDELSDKLRKDLQPTTKFRQLADMDTDAITKELHTGETYNWNVYSDVTRQGRALSEHDPMPETGFTVSQQSLTITEYGQSVPFTGKVTALAKHDVEKLIDKALRDDARKAFDIACWEQFDTCKLRVAPTSGTSTTSVTVTENGATATTNNVAMGTDHIGAIVDDMSERNIPPAVGDDYISIGHPTTFRNLKTELEAIHQYTDPGLNQIFSGEIGRYESCRFVKQNFIPKGGANDSTTHDPYTGTADAWNNAKSSWAFFCGSDLVNEALVIPEEIRAKLPGDYGRSKGIAWYALTGFGIVHTQAANSRIMKWDSAA